jgi:DNA-binding MarR family transcriptional regulator
VKHTLSDLPGILAEKYAANGASANDIIAEMGYKPNAPLSNLNRLIKDGMITKVGDRYHATQAAQRAA